MQCRPGVMLRHPIYPEKETARGRIIGARETWYTRARREWRDAAGPTGMSVWLCPTCGWWPDSYASLPQEKCGNCGQQLRTSGDDPLATALHVIITDFGYRPE